MRATVAMPVAMNVRVATIERAERRLTPQTPCPLVQPLPRRVPTPTASPATTSVAGLAKLASIPPDTNITTSAPRGRPITNIQAPLRSMPLRSEEHTSEHKSLLRIYYADFCLKKIKHTLRT